VDTEKKLQKQSKRNYQRELEKILGELPEKFPDRTPTLLLHSCCAPCSSYCLEYLSEYFEITIFYYNPNIYPPEEYQKRVREQRRFAAEIPTKHPVHVMEGEYDPKQFYTWVKGLEHIREGGARCFACFALRLSVAAEMARKKGFDFVTTTLTISPLKNAARINEIGMRCAAEQSVQWLPSDFKKKEGYKRSIELSKAYGLYRQDYCGCIFSKKEREMFAECKGEKIKPYEREE
jgi:predicted adenine nucleotide alpha hydrolase (AANH) superfamily ATPase